MFRHLTFSLVLSLLVAAFAAAQSEAPAQQPAEEPGLTEKAQQAQQESGRQALALLDEIVAEAQTLRLAENRIRVQALAADLLWTRDEKRARAFFKEAMSNFNQLAVGFDADNAPSHNHGHTTFMLRQEVLQMVAVRDAGLALELLRATRQPNSPTDSPRDSYGSEHHLEQSLAAQIAANDPKLALQIAEDSLAKGFSYQLTNVLAQLKEKDAEAAAKLSRSIAAKLRSENLMTNQEAAGVAINLLQSALLSGAVTPTPSPSPSSANITTATTPVDQQVLRDLIDIVTTAALNAPPNNQHLLMTLQGIMPQLEKHAPTRVPALRRKLAESLRGQDEQTRRWSEFNSLMQNGTLEAMLDAAAKAPSEVRSGFYQQAAQKALGQGDTAHARQIINDHVADPGQRSQMLAQIDRDATWREVNEGKLDEARQSLARIRSTEERANILTQMATGAVGRGDRKLALQLLEEARGLLTSSPKNAQQLSTQLQVARAYIQLEPAHSFEILEAIIDRLNEVLAAAEVLDGFTNNYGLFRDGEMILQPGAGQVDMFYYQYAREIGSLARTDFGRAKQAADRFQRGEARLMARLLVAQGVLADQFDARQNGPAQGRGYGAVILTTGRRRIIR